VSATGGPRFGIWVLGRGPLEAPAVSSGCHASRSNNCSMVAMTEARMLHVDAFINDIGHHAAA
jgi:hypothetical protein